MKQLKQVRITIRFTDTEAEQLKKAAKGQGLTTGAYVRAVLAAAQKPARLEKLFGPDELARLRQAAAGDGVTLEKTIRRCVAFCMVAADEKG